MERKTLILLVLLWLSSIGEVFFPDVMKLNGMTGGTNWFFLAHAIGNTAVGFTKAPGDASLLSCDWKAASIPAIMDIFSYAALFVGVALAGAQTKSILYSSSILWSAVLSRILLGRVLSMMQWGSICLLFLGLALKSGAGTATAGADLDSSFLMGVCCILGGCFMHALANVQNEALIRQGRIQAKNLCIMVGIYSTLIWLGLYSCGLIIPERINKVWVYTSDNFTFDSLMVQDRAAGLPMSSGPAWVGFVFCTAVHAGAFFSLLGSVGSVSSGIVKGATVAAYVLLSGTIFCSVNSSYCLNWRTLCSAAVCVSSVIAYSLATTQAKKVVAKACVTDSVEDTIDNSIMPGVTNISPRTALKVRSTAVGG